MDEPGRGFGAARFIFLYKKSNRKPFDQCSGHFNLYGMRHRCFEFTDELCGGCLSHEFSWDINGGESWIDNASFGDIVEACDGNVFGDFVAASFKALIAPMAMRSLSAKYAPARGVPLSMISSMSENAPSIDGESS